ncbi:MAG: RNA 3'-phosphate cyclase [Anaerolineales bacterium]|nr:RNA 3'-phosphate cyclase [Anaerolineales bacterium]
MMQTPITIDGSQGEGGGQVLRTSLSLAAITGRPLRLYNIRAGRSKPGLRPQHLTAVHAVGRICAARMDGDRLNSRTLEFTPTTPPRGGDYVFDVSDAAQTFSAGAVTLICQAILWPLIFAAEPARVRLRGGTFVPYSPPYHYLAHVARPAFARLGAHFATELVTWGWMQAGGGEMVLTVEPAARLQGVAFAPERSTKVEGVAAVTNLPADIPQRMARRAHNLLQEMGLQPVITPVRATGKGPGAGIVLWLPGAGFSCLGRKGFPADKVAEEAVAQLRAFVDNGGLINSSAVDEHLADQLLLPMALAHGRSSLTTNRITLHTLTNADLLRQWLPVSLHVAGELGQPGTITVTNEV